VPDSNIAPETEQLSAPHTRTCTGTHDQDRPACCSSKGPVKAPLGQPPPAGHTQIDNVSGVSRCGQLLFDRQHFRAGQRRASNGEESQTKPKAASSCTICRQGATAAGLTPQAAQILTLPLSRSGWPLAPVGGFAGICSGVIAPTRSAPARPRNVRQAGNHCRASPPGRQCHPDQPAAANGKRAIRPMPAIPRLHITCRCCRWAQHVHRHTGRHRVRRVRSHPSGQARAHCG